MSIGRALCVLGLHRWQVQKTEDQQRYRTCRRCHKDDPSLPAFRSASGVDNQAWPR